MLDNNEYNKTRVESISLDISMCNKRIEEVHNWCRIWEQNGVIIKKPKGRVELPTSSLLMTCSNQLSYLGADTELLGR